MTKKDKPKANIPSEMPVSAEAELQSHFSEPSYRVEYENGTEIMFNISDIVAVMHDVEEAVYRVILISGFDFDVDESTYNELKSAKNWTNDETNGKFHKID